MDKGNLNNYISKMKGPSKEAIRRNYQKVKKNLAKLDTLSQKIKNDKKLNKIKNQIEKLKNEEELLRSICPDEITKLALVILNRDGPVDCAELSLEEKIKIRIVNCDIVRKMIDKFNTDFSDSGDWIDVAIDLLDTKKIMKSYKNKELVKKLDHQLNQRRNILKHLKGVKDENQPNVSEKNNDLIVDKSMKNEQLQSNSISGEQVAKEDYLKSRLLKKFGEKSRDKSSSDEDESEIQEENVDEEEPMNESESNDEYIKPGGSKPEEESYDDSESNEEVDNEMSNDYKSEDEDLDDNESDDEDSDNEDSDDENSDDDKSGGKPKRDKKLNSDKIPDLQEQSQDYLKRQLIKAFGEKLVNKTSKDVSSDEEWVDDFFIDKKVKKFKPTVVDLERYKDLEAKIPDKEVT